MRIEVDLGRCEGHGLCEEKAPGLLQLDDEGYPVVLVEENEVPEALAGQARDAVAVCPVAALRSS